MGTRAASPAQPLGLIAGDGALPVHIARCARAAGPGAGGGGVSRDHRSGARGRGGARRVAGPGAGRRRARLPAPCRRTRRGDGRQGSKQQLLSGRLELDARAREIFWRASPTCATPACWGRSRAPSRRRGSALRPQAEWVPELLAPEGVLGRVHPTPSQWGDLSFGWPIARALAAWDIGQTVVVQDRTVLAVESIEGTDETIRRGGRLGRPGLCIVKVARPEQDPRFDLPTIGPATLAAAAEAGAQVLAVEARRTLVLDRRGARKAREPGGHRPGRNPGSGSPAGEGRRAGRSAGHARGRLGGPP